MREGQGGAMDTQPNMEWQVDQKAALQEYLERWQPFVLAFVALNGLLDGAKLPRLIRWIVILQYSGARMRAMGQPSTAEG